MQYIVAYDFGTTGVKTCLFSIDGGIRMEASAYAPYGLYILPDGGAEQDAGRMVGRHVQHHARHIRKNQRPARAGDGHLVLLTDAGHGARR